MFERIVLEMSLKPFRKTDEESVRSVCKRVFTQWYPLIKNRKSVSILLWAADGSEILDYNRDPAQEFEWCKFLGTANGPMLGKDEPTETGLHTKKQLYCDDPPVFTYGILKNVIRCLKETGREILPDCEIRIGETFDIGPEFAISEFKYIRHREICSGTSLDDCRFVDACAVLHGDDRAYAAYPDGIPEGTPFGTFLGKQSRIFLSDMGFDYLWLSNGLGFSAEPWSQTGKIYDGEHFHADRLKTTRNKVFDFWRLFRAECPDIPLETRGTNHSVGIDYATDGVPLYDIYRAGFDILPPPNSPWAALNGDFGLELMGHMTRISEIPGKEYLFRYYIHDPWWVNSPWYDRYEGQPHDIYLPMALSRIDENGRVMPANVLSALSLDNSYGNMPDCCANEVIPHLLKAEKESADAPAPLVWVYPIREYTHSENETELSEMYDGDRFISASITAGLPLSSVVSADIFLKAGFSVFSGCILISPVPHEDIVKARLREWINTGGKVLFYGSRKQAEQLKTDFPREYCADQNGAPAQLREALRRFGFEISFCKTEDNSPTPVIMLHRYDHAYLFSVYTPDTTTDTVLSSPFGAPVLLGGEAVVTGSRSVYRFNRAERRECRIFVSQDHGVISAREMAPVNAKYRRALRIDGLRDASIRLLPETDSIETSIIGVDTVHPDDTTPIPDDRYTLIRDEVLGDHYFAEHITGSCIFYMT